MSKESNDGRFPKDSAHPDYIDGRSSSNTYYIYKNMKQRCNNLKDMRYGGRGISVCERWKGEDGYENFIFDMGERPEGMSIERKENDGNYEPDNCVWATKLQQGRNSRKNHLVAYGTLTKTISEWHEWFEQRGWPAPDISTRLRRGWSVEEAIMIPVGVRRIERRRGKDGKYCSEGNGNNES